MQLYSRSVLQENEDLKSWRLFSIPGSTEKENPRNLLINLLATKNSREQRAQKISVRRRVTGSGSPQFVVPPSTHVPNNLTFRLKLFMFIREDFKVQTVVRTSVLSLERSSFLQSFLLLFVFSSVITSHFLLPLSYSTLTFVLPSVLYMVRPSFVYN